MLKNGMLKNYQHTTWRPSQQIQATLAAARPVVPRK